VKAIAAAASADAVTGYTKAMRDRAERTDVVKNFDKPILFLAGEKDPGIPSESVTRQASIARLADVRILPQTAHMGMFENEKKCLEIIQSFIEKNPVTT
jgi:pimeloyl-ACP methyl ester carboxylesterase